MVCLPQPAHRPPRASSPVAWAATRLHTSPHVQHAPHAPPASQLQASVPTTYMCSLDQANPLAAPPQYLWTADSRWPTHGRYHATLAQAGKPTWMVKSNPEHLPPRCRAHHGGWTAQRCGSPMRHDCRGTVGHPACCTPWGAHCSLLQTRTTQMVDGGPTARHHCCKMLVPLLGISAGQCGSRRQAVWYKGSAGRLPRAQLQAKRSASSHVGSTQHCSARPPAPVTHAVPLTHTAVADTHRAHPLPHLATAGRRGWRQQPKLHPTPGTAQRG